MHVNKKTLPAAYPCHRHIMHVGIEVHDLGTWQHFADLGLKLWVTLLLLVRLLLELIVDICVVDNALWWRKRNDGWRFAYWNPGALMPITKI